MISLARRNTICLCHSKERKKETNNKKIKVDKANKQKIDKKSNLILLPLAECSVQQTKTNQPKSNQTNKKRKKKTHWYCTQRNKQTNPSLLTSCYADVRDI